MHPLNKPEVMVSTAQDKVDQDGNITDAKTKEKVAEMVTALADWSKKLNFLK
jgi:chromate reductase